MLVNPVLAFYEWYLTFYQGLPDVFRAFLGLVWGLTIVFALLNIFIRTMK